MTTPSWWEQGKKSGERWRSERAQMIELEAFERLFPDSGIGLSQRCLDAADRIQAGELSEKWTTLLPWLEVERPAGRDWDRRKWLAGFVHGVLEPDAQIPTT